MSSIGCPRFSGKKSDIWIMKPLIGQYYGYHHHHHHHHHIVLAARISLTLSHHSSLSFIALGRSPGQQPVFSHSCWMYVRAGRPAFARPYVGIHKSRSLMSSSLLLQQCPACLVRLTWIVFVIGGRWQYSWCLVGCCCQDLYGCTTWTLTKRLEKKLDGNYTRMLRAILNIMDIRWYNNLTEGVHFSPMDWRKCLGWNYS